MTDEELINLGQKIVTYCNRYFISIEYLFDILNDQKVTPMIRGKATEYEVFLLLKSHLDQSEWSVEKLNLLPSPGMSDEDISVTHRRTGRILKVESKNAVRGSMTSGQKAIIHKEPHFKVKCHRSRSNIKLSGSSNDRYAADVFDVIITNPMNSIIKGKTISPEFEIIQDKKLLEILFDFYGVNNENELLMATTRDWRFVIPSKIADKDGYIPRTPYVMLKDDPNWLPIENIEQTLLKIVKEKKRHKSRRK